MTPNMIKCSPVLIVALVVAGNVHAGVSAEEAAKLKGELTPVGAERAGNREGTIPAWSGGLTTPTPGFQNGGRRPDPFAAEKPTLQITAKNMDSFADKLPEGAKAMLRKYPDSFRIDVYPTHRTAAAPQWVYDNTSQNATRASVQEGSAGPISKGAFGGFPFPVPKTGVEVMLNTQVRWRGTAWNQQSTGYQVTADGRPVLVHAVNVDNIAPYYYREEKAENFDGAYWMVRVSTSGPAIRAGPDVDTRTIQ